MPAVYFDSKIFFLCEMYFKKPKQIYVGATAWYDPLVGRFDAIKDQEITCFGHFGTALLALAKNKQFFLLTDNAWESASIPPLPADNLQDPIILTYHSFLIIVNGDVIWVHDDNLCGWMQFALTVEGGKNLDGSPKNSFAILAGKLFACSSLQEMVYSVELQQMVDITLSYSKTIQNSLLANQENLKPRQVVDTMEVEDSLKDALKDACLDETQVPNSNESPKWTLQLNLIFKGASFIFLHSENLLAFHSSSTSVDRAWYYDVRCYHWHNVEYDSSKVGGKMLKNRISLSNGASGILDLVLQSAWAMTSSWGRAKLYEIQLIK